MTKWGIAGTGMIAKSFAEALKETDSVLHAVASTSGRSEKFASNYECLAYEGYEQLINDPDVQAIYIATPHPSHFDIALSALKSNKAVLCEKPMTMNATQTMILIDASRKNNTPLMEAFMYKSHPQTLKICEILKESFKPPLTIDAEFCFQVEVPESHRLVNRELGGGSILDIGCYPMSISRLAVGKVNGKDFLNPNGIECESELNSQGVDLNAQANLTFEDGSTAHIKSATNLASESTVTIKDASNTLIINQPWHCGEYTERTSSLELQLGSNEFETIEISTEKGIYAIEIEHFEELIESESIESNIVPHNDSHGNMIALDRWRKGSGVYYESDKGENVTGSLFSFDIKENRKDIKRANLPGIEKDLSRLVFGCDNQSDSNHAFAMFDHFYLSGGNVFDTAYIYNNGKSDGYLGRWINSRGLRDEVVILGKGAHTPDCYPNKIRPQLEETLERMGTDYLDIYCLHRDNLEVPVSEFIDALSELKDEGLINVFGGSNWSLPRFKEAIDYANENNKTPFSMLSNNFSLARMLEPVWPGCFSCSEEDYKLYLEEHQIAIFPWSSQARGFFLESQEFQGLQHVADPNKDEQDRVWTNEENLERRKRCFQMAQEKELEPIQISLAFVLNQPFPTFPLIGARNLFETESSLEALNLDLSSEEVNWLDLSEN